MYDVFKMLALPPASLVLVLLAGLLVARRWRRTGLTVAVLAALTLYALSTPFVATRLLVLLESRIPTIDAGPAPQAIIVLSAGFVFDGPRTREVLADPMTLSRLRRGARLHRETGLPIMVSGGASPRHPARIGDLMREALRRDFAVGARWVEGKSTNTYENALFSARLLRRDGIAAAYLVTQAWHLPRALAAFDAVGYAVYPVAASYSRPSFAEIRSFIPSAKALLRSTYAAHEALGLIWYRLTLFRDNTR